jgi:eukaryotic translation initiation factor 2C
MCILLDIPVRTYKHRDGVSESQFETVLDYERRKLLEGCRAEGCTPKVTFITVQKRHHTRFRPMDAARGIGRMRNIPPGTTVDSHVVHPTDFDFYLCSHEGIQVGVGVVFSDYTPYLTTVPTIPLTL